MMPTIDMTYIGDLQVEATHIQSGVRLTTDPPVDNQGKGRSFSPTDLVATSLGACMTTIMAMVAERHGIDLKGLKISVTKEMVAKPIRRIGRLAVVFEFKNKVEEKYKALLKNAAETCPVHQSLHPDVKMDVEYKWAN